VGTITREEAGRRAGVPNALVDRATELGLLEADDRNRLRPAAVRRLILLQSLQASGVSLDSVAAISRDEGLTLDFLDASGYDMFAPLSDRTFGEVAASRSIPMELLVAIREVMCGPPPRPEDRMREDELRIVPWAETMLGLGIRPATLDRMLRVYGDTTRRIAEAEADLWQTGVEDRLLAEGRPMAEVANFARDQSATVTEVSDATVQAIHGAQRRQAWGAKIVASLAGALARAGLHNRVERPPAMCFLDVSGYSRLTQERGDTAAADLAEDVRRLVDRTAARHGGRTVKWLGDGVMLHFPDPGEAVRAALAMLDGIREAGLPPAHIGLDAGPVVFQEGDYFGQTVNLASRIGEYARPDEVLASQAVVDAAGAPEDVRFTEIGAVNLKGVGSIILHRARAA
jgi:adenylate cyclase